MFFYARKKEIEHSSFPLWLANFAISHFKGEESISFEEFINSVNERIESSPVSEHRRNPEEITEELKKVAEFSRKKVNING